MPPKKLHYLLLLVVCGLASNACNPGNCLRMSDCPLGATCEEGLCRVPPQPRTDAASTQESQDVNSTNSEQSPIVDALADAGPTLAP